MRVAFVGSVTARPESELLPPRGPAVQPRFIAALARQYEAAGFEAVWIGQSATSVDAGVVAHAVLTATERLAVVVTLPPDVREPLAAVRAVATLAALFPGRVQVRVPPAPRDSDGHVQFGVALHELWRVQAPLPHGYRFARSWAILQPEPAPLIVAHAAPEDPRDRTAASDRAVAGYADVVVVPAAEPAAVAARIGRLVELAGGRPVQFAVAVRPLVGEDADAVADLTRRAARVAPVWAALEDTRGAATHALAAMTGARPGVEPFVGTAEVIAERLAEYRSAGVSLFQLRGFDPQPDLALHAAAAAALTAASPATPRGQHVHVA